MNFRARQQRSFLSPSNSIRLVKWRGSVVVRFRQPSEKRAVIDSRGGDRKGQPKAGRQPVGIREQFRYGHADGGAGSAARKSVVEQNMKSTRRQDYSACDEI